MGGEKSTRYFLRLLNRTNPENFKLIKNSDGETLVDPTEVEREIVRYYKSLYEDYDKSDIVESNPDDVFFANIESVGPAQDSLVSDPISVDELGKTLAGCKDSCPGPDGIPYSYYKSLWRIAGPILIDAWNHSLATGKLAPSHQVSFLKLIPKLGKDLTLMTNWRPITLSNCDHKLITKTYSNRMSQVVAEKIKARQTAYLKGRLINDNIRTILATINLSNIESEIDGLLVSLDARKAFDSIEHRYIENCLIRFGLHRFVPIFKILYSNLRSDILINGKIVNGYRILRGVKQGDALSCILFIMCMEPLLRNIETNPIIDPITTEAVGPLPKTCAYADDVSGLIKNNQKSLQGIFDEYSKLSRVSGLVLNAEKTEIMRINQSMKLNFTPSNYEITYLGVTHRTQTLESVKINGIFFQQDTGRATTENVDRIVRKTDGILVKWSARHLSILGRILILKTFAVSQLIYLMQSLILNETHFKLFNHILYKFIWNRHYRASKAPERIKREIINTPIKLGGFGMLDVAELDKGLKLRALARLLTSNHPFLTTVREGIDLRDFFAPKSSCNWEPISHMGVRLLGQIRKGYIGNPNLSNNLSYLSAIGKHKLRNAVSAHGRNSMVYFNIVTRGKSTLGELNQQEIRQLSRFLDEKLVRELTLRNLSSPLLMNQNVQDLILVSNKLVDISKLSSRQLRACLREIDPICLYKLGIILTPSEALTWTSNVNKITSVKYKSTLMRLAHGDIYTKEKLFRFSLIASPNCPRCGEVETLRHKFIECDYVARIWSAVTALTDKLKTAQQPGEDIERIIVGAATGATPTVATIHAEVIQRILYLKDEPDYLIRPRTVANLAVATVMKNEKSISIKRELETLLSDY